MSRVEIAEFWKGCSLLKPPFVHPADVPVLESRFGDLSKDLPGSFDDFVNGPRFGNSADKNFHFALYPHPYAGDLATADIFVLQLNPGMNVADYLAELNEPMFRSLMERNLHQKLEGSDFPFWPLNPSLCSTPGYRWWESKLREVCAIVARRKYHGSYVEGLRQLSRRLAVIELVPYHSVVFENSALVRELPSAQAAIRFVKSDLLKRVDAGRALIIAARRVNDWGLRNLKSKWVIPYSGSLSRGSSFSPRTPGGEAILEYLRISDDASMT